MDQLKTLLSSRRFETFITALIVINAITLGLETVPEVMQRFGVVLTVLDRVILGVFVVEVSARLLAWRLDFFRDPWRIFDLVVVGVALIPATGSLSVLPRASHPARPENHQHGAVAQAGCRRTGQPLPGMGSIMLLLTLVFYVFSVMATKLYGDTFPDWFGSIPASAYSLFQVMTLESWSMGIVRPVMEVHPMAWAFFIPFIACTTFTVLNLFIGIIVSAMQEEHEAEATADREAMASDQSAMLEELRAIRKELAEMRAAQAGGQGTD
jgi:voltage-gated sodium channel